jgi:hypothetical protein
LGGRGDRCKIIAACVFVPWIRRLPLSLPVVWFRVIFRLETNALRLFDIERATSSIPAVAQPAGRDVLPSIGKTEEELIP